MLELFFGPGRPAERTERLRCAAELRALPSGTPALDDPARDRPE